jgi:hypothetical protein
VAVAKHRCRLASASGANRSTVLRRAVREDKETGNCGDYRVSTGKRKLTRSSRPIVCLETYHDARYLVERTPFDCGSNASPEPWKASNSHAAQRNGTWTLQQRCVRLGWEYINKYAIEILRLLRKVDSHTTRVSAQSRRHCAPIPVIVDA